MRQQMCDIDKNAGTPFFAVARRLPAHTAQYVCVCRPIYVHTRNSLEITWRDEKSIQDFSRKGQTKNIHVENLDVDGISLILMLNNEDVHLIN